MSLLLHFAIFPGCSFVHCGTLGMVILVFSLLDGGLVLLQHYLPPTAGAHSGTTVLLRFCLPPTLPRRGNIYSALLLLLPYRWYAVRVGVVGFAIPTYLPAVGYYMKDVSLMNIFDHAYAAFCGAYAACRQHFAALAVLWHSGDIYSWMVWDVGFWMNDC